MNYWQKLKRWEKRLEKGPKGRILKLMALIFSISLMTGIMLSTGLKTMQMKSIEAISQDITRLEKNRMDKRIELLKNLLYERELGESF